VLLGLLLGAIYPPSTILKACKRKTIGSKENCFTVFLFHLIFCFLMRFLLELNQAISLPFIILESV